MQLLLFSVTVFLFLAFARIYFFVDLLQIWIIYRLLSHFILVIF